MADTGGFRIDFDTRGLERIAKKYIRKGGKLTTLLEQAGARIERNTLQRIENKKNVDGSRFKELSPRYKKKKKKNKHRILVATGLMVKTLTYDVLREEEVRIGFGDEKAKWLIYDGSGREPLGVSPSDVVDISEIAEDILDLS